MRSWPGPKSQVQKDIESGKLKVGSKKVERFFRKERIRRRAELKAAERSKAK
jgi:hypothetical protein